MNELVETLLYEGYALYPYTPGATKNATPTPFGIVYPPAYAAGLDTTFDHLELRCVVEGGGEIEAGVRFLAPSGERHRAEPHAVEGSGDFEVGGLSVRTRLEESPLDGGRRLVSYRVENRTEAPEGLDRAAAIGRSLISTHPLLRVAGGRFLSQLEEPCDSVNTWPVLASPADDVMLGAAIVLPDHPQIAPESRGNLFDNTEIEEALVLHVQVLSDEEREQIAEADPAVREMIERASAVTSEELSRLHGRVTLSPPEPSSAVRDPTQGLPEVEVDGVVFRRGGRVVVRPGLEADLQARMLEGRTVTVERIQRDYDGRVHLGVALDEPGQEILRETGRFLWFFPPEVEVVSEAEPRDLASMDAGHRRQEGRQDGGASQ
ncbi:MAG: hypothetical protein QOE60_2200 [Thermoleophilaceae bacterium]|nr:hypothetical protein [Thermoleophilaceae bacterium]